MSLIHSPRIVTDGLKLVLDAGVPTSWNAGISTNWTDKIGGNNGTLVNGTSHTDGPFVGAGYVEFDGTGDYLNFTNIDVGTDDFTYEAWIYPTESGKDNPAVIYTSSLVHICGLYDTSGGTNAIFGASTRPGSGNYVLYAPDITLNTWHHIAWVKSGSSLKIYVDGVNQTLTDSGSFSGTQSNNVSYIGTTVSNEYFEGYISNARVIGGTALYTSNFTPPTKPLTAVTNTKLLTCQGNAIADASSSAHSISVTGNAAARLGFPKSAFEFDGTDDYVAITNTANLRLGNEDFTIDSWVQFGTGLSVSESIFGVWDNTNNQRSYLFYYYADGDDLYFSASSDGTGSGITNVVANNVGFIANRWYHLVASRISGTTTIYIDGVSSASGTQNFSFYNNTTDTFAIGATNVDHSITNQLKGKISNVKVHKGKGLTAEEVTQNYNATKGRYA